MEVRMNGFTPNDSLLRHWNVLWNELEPATARMTAPTADVIEDADIYHFYFEMAGISSESVDVRVEDGNLDRRGRAQESRMVQGRRGASVRAGVRQDASRVRDARGRRPRGIKAAYKDGVLEVTVPKRPESKPFKIKVEVEN